VNPKLDRLSRNAAFLLAVRDSGVRFVAVDMPEANDLTVGMMALVEQQKREGDDLEGHPGGAELGREPACASATPVRRRSGVNFPIAFAAQPNLGRDAPRYPRAGATDSAPLSRVTDSTTCVSASSRNGDPDTSVKRC
jgi:hypothetical protein